MESVKLRVPGSEQMFADPATALVPELPDILARTPVAAPLLSVRMANSLLKAGVSRIGELQGWTFVDFLIDGVGEVSVRETVDALAALARLPQDRLARLSAPLLPLIPNLPVEVIRALCFATSVDEEIAGLVADLPERNRALVLARWGYGAAGGRTLEEVGQAFGLTRERTRQIVAAREKQLAAAGVRLPLASEAVCDLDEAGGVLPDADYQLLLRYSQVHVSTEAMRMLPALCELRVIPELNFDPDARLWVTGNGRGSIAAAGGARQLTVAARGRANRFMRRVGAVPLRVVDELSPFGRDHALSLLSRGKESFEIVAGYALRVPLLDTALLRQCRKTLAATASIDLNDLVQGLRQAGFAVDPSFVEDVLQRSHDFRFDNGRVRFSENVRRSGILSPAEERGFALLEGNGGAMSWWDFIEAMKQAGFSAAMAAVVLRKPAVQRLGPSTYGLRGRSYDATVLDRLDARRRKLMGRRTIKSVVAVPNEAIRVIYTLNRFAIQGVLPVPADLRRYAGQWRCTFPGSARVVKVRISKGFMWPLQAFMKHELLQPGDEITALFERRERVVRIEINDRARTGPNKVGSREEQILKALFGDDA